MTATIRGMFNTGPARSGEGEGTWTWRVEPIAAHPVHGGHFPGRPVTPGAALVQLVQYLSSEVKGGTLRLKTARHIKFLTPVDPVKCSHFDLRIALTEAADDIGFDAEATTDAYDGNPVVLLKMKGTFAR